jgi:O-antigen biosynthesis protein
VPSTDRDNEPASYQYDFVVDLGSDNTHANVIKLIGEGRRVLELGPASGYMSEILRERGCTVVGIEIDAEMADQAARFCERVIVGDLDALDLEAELEEDHFDVIVAADVLEHLKDPLRLLKELRAFLSPGGYFVVSLPNVAHASVRLALLEGRFEYQDLGLLDRTHLHFFTHESIGQLFDEAELAMVEIHRQEAPIDTTEIAVDLEAVPPEIIRELKQDRDALTYQFVIKAVPLEASGMRELQSRLRAQALALDAAEVATDAAELARDAAERELGLVREQNVPRMRELEEALAAISNREGEVRVALIEAHDQILRRDEQIEEFNAKLRKLVEERQQLQERLASIDQQHAAVAARLASAGEQLAVCGEEIRELRVRLARILNSPPARIYSSLGRLPLLRAVVKRRTAGYQKALRDTGRSGE